MEKKNRGGKSHVHDVVVTQAKGVDTE